MSSEFIKLDDDEFKHGNIMENLSAYLISNYQSNYTDASLLNGDVGILFALLKLDNKVESLERLSLIN